MSETSSADPNSATSRPSNGTWRRVGQWVWDYWHWPVLAGVLVYLYLQLFPMVDLSTPGEPVPSFAAQTLEGETFRLSEHRGEVVVVNVWATWCGPCRVEMPGFQDVHASLADEDVQFVGVAVDRTGTEDVETFVASQGVTFPQIASPQLAARYFPGTTVPRTYLIDREGRIRYEHTGIWMASSLEDAVRKLLKE